ncbi:MAG: addiction module protein [Gloeotrichia echinulata DEX184]|nr:addiction module protein [Gloeotrichia echinulata DEX184]
MDITATLNEIAALSIEDRIHLVQAIWDSIAAEQAYPDLTEAEKREMDYRIDDYEMNPDNVLTWKKSKHLSRESHELRTGISSRGSRRTG